MQNCLGEHLGGFVGLPMTEIATPLVPADALAYTPSRWASSLRWCPVFSRSSHKGIVHSPLHSQAAGRDRSVVADATRRALVSIDRKLLQESDDPPFEVLEVSTRKGDILEGKPVLDMVLFPGNPGLPAYYEDFAIALVEKLAHETLADVRLTTLGYLGHGEDACIGASGLFSIEEQIEHCKGWFATNRAECSNTVAVLGHSIGAFVALEVLRSYPEYVEKAVLLTPFLQNNDAATAASAAAMISAARDNRTTPFFKDVTQDATVAGRAAFSRLRSLASLPLWALRGLAYLIDSAGRLPVALRKDVMRKLGITWPGMTSLSEEITVKCMLRYGTVLNYGFMGGTEFKRLAKPLDYEWIRAYGADRITALFVQNDFWAPIWLAQSLASAGGLGNACRIVEGDHVKHAFVTSKEGIDEIVHNLIPELARLVRMSTARKSK